MSNLINELFPLFNNSVVEFLYTKKYGIPIYVGKDKQLLYLNPVSAISRSKYFSSLQFEQEGDIHIFEDEDLNDRSNCEAFINVWNYINGVFDAIGSNPIQLFESRSVYEKMIYYMDYLFITDMPLFERVLEPLIIKKNKIELLQCKTQLINTIAKCINKSKIVLYWINLLKEIIN